MSAVIWCGIVAVWIFVLIPTWVRRGDIHWHRGTVGQTATAQGPIEGHAQNVEGGSGRRLHLPGTRRTSRTRAELPVEVETMDQQVAQSPAEERVSAAVPPAAPRVRVAAAPSSGRLGGAVRASFGTGPKGSRKKPTLRVRRARRLVALATLAIITLIIAIFAGGLFIAVNLVVDVALLLYVRHLRGIAKERQAKAAREKRARAARQEWDKVSAQERASQLDGWRAPAAEPVAASYGPVTETYEYETAEVAYQPATEAYEASYEAGYEQGYEQVEADYESHEGEYAEGEYAEAETAGAPESIDLDAVQQPTLIDLTDAPTEELTTARAS